MLLADDMNAGVEFRFDRPIFEGTTQGSRTEKRVVPIRFSRAGLNIQTPRR